MCSRSKLYYIISCLSTLFQAYSTCMILLLHVKVLCSKHCVQNQIYTTLETKIYNIVYFSFSCYVNSPFLKYSYFNFYHVILITHFGLFLWYCIFIVYLLSLLVWQYHSPVDGAMSCLSCSRHVSGLCSRRRLIFARSRTLQESQESPRDHCGGDQRLPSAARKGKRCPGS